jgi:hypothetical protein
MWQCVNVGTTTQKLPGGKSNVAMWQCRRRGNVAVSPQQGGGERRGEEEEEQCSNVAMSSREIKSLARGAVGCGNVQ